MRKESQIKRFKSYSNPSMSKSKIIEFGLFSVNSESRVRLPNTLASA